MNNIDPNWTTRSQAADMSYNALNNHYDNNFTADFTGVGASPYYYQPPLYNIHPSHRHALAAHIYRTRRIYEEIVTHMQSQDLLLQQLVQYPSHRIALPSYVRSTRVARSNLPQTVQGNGRGTTTTTYTAVPFPAWLMELQADMFHSNDPTPPTEAQIDAAVLRTTYGLLGPRVQETNPVCAISLEHFGEDDAISMIRHCRHVFAEGALRRWFSTHSTCPVCRYNIITGQSGTTSGEQTNVSPQPDAPQAYQAELPTTREAMDGSHSNPYQTNDLRLMLGALSTLFGNSDSQVTAGIFGSPGYSRSPSVFDDPSGNSLSP